MWDLTHVNVGWAAMIDYRSRNTKLNQDADIQTKVNLKLILNKLKPPAEHREAASATVRKASVKQHISMHPSMVCMLRTEL